jgi:ribosomal protein S20
MRQLSSSDGKAERPRLRNSRQSSAKKTLVKRLKRAGLQRRAEGSSLAARPITPESDTAGPVDALVRR